MHALFARNLREILVLFGINFATLVNMFLMIFVAEKLLFDSEGSGTKGGMLAGVFVIKTIILLSAFIVGVHFVGNRVILSVINYAVQIIVLVVFLYNYFCRVNGVENK